MSEAKRFEAKRSEICWKSSGPNAAEEGAAPTARKSFVRQAERSGKPSASEGGWGVGGSPHP